ELMRRAEVEQTPALAQRTLGGGTENKEAAAPRSEAEAAAPRGLAPQKPLLVGGAGPPPHLVGRVTEVSQVFQSVLKGGNVAIYGEQTMGKSSLLNYFGSSLSWARYGLNQDPFVFVSVDCLSLGPFSPGKFWGYVARAIEEQFS